MAVFHQVAIAEGNTSKKLAMLKPRHFRPTNHQRFATRNSYRKSWSLPQAGQLWRDNKNLYFPNVPCTQTCPVRFLSIFGEKGAAPGTVPLHSVGGTSQQEPCEANVPSGLVPGTLLWTYFWAFLGQEVPYRTRAAPGTLPLRNPEGMSQKACLENPENFQLGPNNDRQITHLICVRLKHLLYDFFSRCFGPLKQKKKQKRKEAQNTPKKVI